MIRYPASATNAFAASVVVDTGTGKLHLVNCYNSNGSDRYLQIFDAAALPDNGTVPLSEVKVATTGTGTLDFGSAGLPYSNGLVAALSSTAATLTIAVAADGLFCAIASNA